MSSTLRCSSLGSLIGLCLFFGSCASEREALRPQIIATSAHSFSTLGRGQISNASRGWLRAFSDDWREKGVVAQGYLGLGFLSEVERQQSNGTRVDGSSDDLAVLPVGGGGFQRRLGGEALIYGVEGFLAASGRNNEQLIRTASGGGSAPVSVDLLLLDAYGGPFMSFDVSDRWRLYGSAGPLLQFAQWDESLVATRQSNKGLGLGVYARIGMEYAYSSRDLIGLALRWSDSEANLRGGQGDVQLGGVQLVLTVSRVL